MEIRCVEHCAWWEHFQVVQLVDFFLLVSEPGATGSGHEDEVLVLVELESGDVVAGELVDELDNSCCRERE
jgi:hypothetical protein